MSNYNEIPKIIYERINIAALDDRTYEQWAPGGKVEGDDYVALNPRREDNSRNSFRISVSTGRWIDKAIENASGGDAVSLYAYLNDMSNPAACIELAKQFGIEIPEQKGDPVAKARWVWEHAKPAPKDHPYLARKGLEPHGTRVYKGLLVVPVYDPDGALRTVQMIRPHKKPGKRDKNFIKGSKAKGCSLTLGEINPTGIIPIAEGWATALSGHLALETGAVVAFSGDGLKIIAKQMQAQYPDASILILGDADRSDGRAKAHTAAHAVPGAKVVLPVFSNPASGAKDFDDLRQAEGLATVRRQLLECSTDPDMTLVTVKKPLLGMTVERPEKIENPKQSIAADIIGSQLDNFAFDLEIRDWRQYTRGYWRVIHKDRIKAVIRKLIDEQFFRGYSISYLNGITDLVQLAVLMPEHRSQHHLLPFQNGVLDLKTHKLGPHNPDLYLTWQLPYAYDPSATCKPIQTWLTDTYGSTTQVMRAYLNAIVMGRADLHRFMELVGPGGSGKGTFLWLAESLVGSENTFITELKHLEQSRFETSNIHGKRLVLITDSAHYSGSVDVLKALTGGDSIRFEQKNKQGGMHFKPQAMVLIAANEAIQTPDYTSGLRRRRLTILLTDSIPLEKQRPLVDEFTPHLPGLLNWVLEMPENEVTELIKSTKSIAAMQKESLLETNPLASWLDSNCVYEKGHISYTGKCIRNGWGYESDQEWLYPNYKLYCESIGVNALSLHRFSRVLDDLCRIQLRIPGVYRGLRTRFGRPFYGLRIRLGEGDGDKPSPMDFAGRGE